MPDAARLLIVDDNKDAADTLADLLRVLGYEVRCAGDSASAMKVIAEYVPRLALLDIGLPDEDGYALAQRMRAEASMEGVKLVALSGYDSDRARPGQQAFDAHLVKPVDIEKLLALVEKMVA